MTLSVAENRAQQLRLGTQVAHGSHVGRADAANVLDCELLSTRPHLRTNEKA
jgi:hypothetical protein